MAGPDPALTDHVSYLSPGMAVRVTVHSREEAAAVKLFANASSYECPAPADARPVYHCSARTHANGEVLWG